jgi:hypothetical protein
MAGAFQSSAFQNSAFQTDAVAGAGITGGGFIVAHRAGDELRHTGANFSRKRWRELLALVEQEREAAETKAGTLRKPGARNAVQAAADTAEEAIAAARAGIATAKAAADLRAMGAALEAAAGAKSLAAIIAQAKQAQRLAEIVKAAMREQAEIDDDEDAITVLLSS